MENRTIQIDVKEYCEYNDLPVNYSKSFTGCPILLTLAS